MQGAAEKFSMNSINTEIRPQAARYVKDRALTASLNVYPIIIHTYTLPPPSRRFLF